MLQNISFMPPFQNPTAGTFNLYSRHLSYCGCNYNWQLYNEDCFSQYAMQQPALLANASAKRLSEFIAGRYCAAQAMHKLYEPSPSSLDNQLLIKRDGSPGWPKNIIGSISHSGDRAMAVCGQNSVYAGLGIDCETLLADSAAADIADLILQPDERDFLLNRQLDFGFLITLAFSAKESLFKALSPSVANLKSFHDFSISGITAEQLTLRPTKKLNGKWSTTAEFSIDYVKQAKYIVTMAVIPATNR